MELTDARVLGALCATEDADPMTAQEIARAARVETSAAAASLRFLTHKRLASQPYPHAQPDRWQITGTGVAVARKPVNREHIRRR